MKRFCVRCGKETNALIDSLCSSCYTEKHNVLSIPESIVFEYDNRSERIRVGRKWIDYSPALVQQVLTEKIESLSSTQKVPVNTIVIALAGEKPEILAKVSFTALVDNVPIPVSREINLKFRHTLSDASMKISSYYHEAIIQLRFKDKENLSKKSLNEKLSELTDLITEQKKKIELSTVIDVKNVRGGLDVLIGSAKAAKKVAVAMAKKHNVRPIYSNKQIGAENDTGKAKFRHTYCLKF